MSIYEDKFELFKKELDTIRADYPNLYYRITEDELFLEGEISFDLTCTYKNERIKDSYLIQISFPPDYPETLPKVKEIGGRIASNFHQSRGTLCLGVPSEVYLVFKEDPTVKHFIKELLEPYLYSHSYSEKHDGKMPFGSRSHYGRGITEYYSEVFGTKDEEVIIKFLEHLLNKDYKQGMLCPCGSKKKIKKCHRKIFLSRYNKVPDSIIAFELKHIKTDLSDFTKYLR